VNARTARGYTLLEVVIAFGVLALALTMLLGILTNSSRQVRWAGDAGRAALLADSLLDGIEMEAPLREGRRDGVLEDGRYRWALDVRPWRDPARGAGPVDPAAPRLLELHLTLAWAEGGPRERLEMRSLRIAPAGVQASP
jgi:general secretion pathway protein I